MKILHLLDTLAMGGKEVFTVGLASHQRAAGIDARIATFDPGNVFEAELRAAGIPHARFDRRPGPFDLRLARGIRAHVLAEGIDLLHCHSENPAVYGALALLGRSRPAMVMTIHSGDRDGIPFRHKLEHWIAYRRAAKVICVAPSVRERIVDREFAPAAKTLTLFNGVAKPGGGDAEGAAALRRELGIGSATTVVTCVGRFHPVKNHLAFLEAFALAMRDLGDAVLVLAGEGTLRGEIEAKAAALGIGSQVRMPGVRRDVGRILAATDIYALPSLNEGHSISLLEACSHGKAVLASRRGGNPDIVVHGESGLLADPGNPGEMAEALIRMARDPGLRARLGAAAERTFRDRFSMDACAAGYADIYLETLGKVRAG